jgi:hypothetical protein
MKTIKEKYTEYFQAIRDGKATAGIFNGSECVEEVLMFSKECQDKELDVCKAYDHKAVRNLIAEELKFKQKPAYVSLATFYR